MKQLVIIAGGFHPFHAGHLALYQSAEQAFPGADVKVAATNDTSARPFPFKLKDRVIQFDKYVKPEYIEIYNSLKSKLGY